MQTNKFAYTSMCEKLKTLYDELQVIDAEIIASMCWMVFVEDGPTRETQAELAYALDVPMIYAAGGTPSGVTARTRCPPPTFWRNGRAFPGNCVELPVCAGVSAPPASLPMALRRKLAASAARAEMSAGRTF